MGNDLVCPHFAHTTSRSVVDLLVHLESGVSVLHNSGNTWPIERQVDRDGSELNSAGDQQYLWPSVHSRGDKEGTQDDGDMSIEFYPGRFPCRLGVPYEGQRGIC